MSLQHPAVEGLADAVGGDETEALDLCCAQQMCGVIPPVHHEICRLGYVTVDFAERLGVAIPQSAPHHRGTDKRRIPHHEVRLRPLGLPGVEVAQLCYPDRLVGHLPSRDGVRFGGASIPVGQRSSLLVCDPLHPVIGEYRVPTLDVAEVPDDGLLGQGVPLGAKVPLEVAYPQDHLGNLRRSWVDLEPQELLRGDSDAHQV